MVLLTVRVWGLGIIIFWVGKGGLGHAVVVVLGAVLLGIYGRVYAMIKIVR